MASRPVLARSFERLIMLVLQLGMYDNDAIVITFFLNFLDVFLFVIVANQLVIVGRGSSSRNIAWSLTILFRNP